MNKLILPLAVLIFAFPAFAQKRPIRKPAPKPIRREKLLKSPQVETKTPTQKVYVMKLNGEYVYGLLIGADTEIIALKVNDSTVTIKLDEIDKVIFREGIATRIGTRNAETTDAATDSAELTYRGSGDSTSSGSPRKISGGVLNGKAETLVRPEYPAAARAVRASGAVNVQVTIDEQGNIIEASAVSGHPLLRQAAENAARASKFVPTTLQGQPVSVTGIIVYNFVP